MATKPDRLEFVLSGLPALRRDTRHWRVRHREQQEWRVKVRGALPPEWLGRKLASSRLEFTRFRAKESDYDNLVQSFKSILDGLTHWGVIADDKPSVIGSPKYRWERTARGEGRIRVVVETLT